MKTVWCWRCKKNVPMLEEHEYQEVLNLQQEYHQKTGLLLMKHDLMAARPLLEQLKSLEAARIAKELELFEKLTGETPEDAHAVHHRVANYGLPCPNCGKNLRTPKARQCLECGWTDRIPTAQGNQP